MKSSVQFLAAVLGLTASMPFQMVNPLLSIYVHDYLKAPLDEVGIIISVLGISSLVTKLLVGMVVPPRRVVKLVMAGHVIFILMPLFYSLAPSAWTMYPLRIVHGARTGVFWVSSSTLVSMISPREDREKTFTNYATATAFGLVGGPALSTFLVTFIGVRMTFTLTTFLFIPTLLVTRKFLSMGDWSGLSDERGGGLRDFMQVLRNPIVMKTSLGYVSFSFIVGALISYGILHGRQTFSLSEDNVSGLFAVYFLLALLARLAMARFLVKLTPLGFTKIGLANAALGFLGLSLSPSLPVFILFFILLGFSHGIVWPASSLVITRTVDSKDLVTANSVILSGFDLGFFFGSIFPAILISTMGMATTLALCSLVPAAALLNMVRRARPQLSPRRL